MSSTDAGIRAFKDMAGAVRALANVPSQVAALAAPKLGALLDRQFVEMQSPYGTEWAPLASSTIARKRANKTRILQRTRDMRLGVKVQPKAGAGLAMTSSQGYLAFHQIGTRDMPQRVVLPTGTLPLGWREVIGKATEQATRQRLARGAA